MALDNLDEKKEAVDTRRGIMCPFNTSNSSHQWPVLGTPDEHRPLLRIPLGEAEIFDYS